MTLDNLYGYIRAEMERNQKLQKLVGSGGGGGAAAAKVGYMWGTGGCRRVECGWGGRMGFGLRAGREWRAA